MAPGPGEGCTVVSYYVYYKAFNLLFMFAVGCVNFEYNLKLFDFD